MATAAGLQNGNIMFFTLDGIPQGHTTSCTMDLTLETVDATTKDTGGFAASIPTLVSATGSFEGFVDFTQDGTSDNNFDSLVADGILAKTEFVAVFGTGETGDTILTFNCFLTSVSATAGKNEIITYSGSIVSTGAIVSSVA